jgi:myosin-1
MFYNMKSYHESQCVIISGESGAGKTEAAKRIMQYIASVSGESSQGIQKIKDMVLATNPLLESFGCAKTLRNDNSSRHGKYLEILFNRQGEPIGANITNYLLEKARVVGQIKNERNFHIFYQFSKGASQQHREMYGIQGPETYTYTSASKCTSVNSIDDVSDFQQTINAMQIIGLGQGEQDQIFRLLAAILWIGNIDFVENDEGNSAIRDSSVTNFVAYLLDVDAEAIEKALTIRIIETSRGGRRGSVYESPLNPVQARAVKDALAKAIYNNLFDWIVSRVNQSLQTQGAAEKTIGILDIYGFEIFENNSFEQICINYVNEKLQQIFIELTLKAEQEEYVREQIEWTPIKYFNNKIVCDLIEERRPPGIFSVLNDACATAHADPTAADQNFGMKLEMLSNNAHFETRQSKFLIKHYAGDVMYDVAGMTDKNKDQLQKDILVLVGRSNNQFLTSLFPDAVDTESKRRPPTASDKIKQSANALMETLSRAEPSYIRTIKPNQNRSPKEYDEKAVLHQVKYLGLQENVRIRRAGFAYRQTFDKFTERFYLLSPKTSYAGDYIWQGDTKEACKQILKDTNIPTSEYQMGVSKVFIKTPETLFALEHMRDMYWHNMAARIQRAWRAYLKYKSDMATKIQRAWREYKGSKKYTDLRDKGHQVLGGRKERRRYSLLGYRRFWGDYLGCNIQSGPGGFLMKAIGVSERVTFSCRGETLHAKFGRSSQRVSRIFVLTQSKLFIVTEEVLNRQLTYHIERSVPVSSIRQVSMSNLRDDWIALSIGSSSEPDPFIWCVFKTELVTHLNVPVNIDSTLQYNKKPGKPTTVKFQKDTTVPRDDTYKSGVVHVPPGEPANSVSEPVPKPKPKPQSSKPQKRQAPRRVPAPSQPKPAPQAQPLPGGHTEAQAVPQMPAQIAQPVQQQHHAPPPQPQPSVETSSSHGAAATAAQAALASSQQHNGYSQSSTENSTGTVSTPATSTSTASKRASKVPPPPPPPQAPAAAKPNETTAKVLYDYTATGSNELSIVKDEIVVILKDENNGWVLAKKQSGGSSGWTPAAYVEVIKSQPPVKKKAPPPAPPKKPKPAALQAGNASSRAASSSVTPQPDSTPGSNGSSNPNLASGLAEAMKQKKQEDSNFAGGLANALKARSQATRSDDESDDDW